MVQTQGAKKHEDCVKDFLSKIFLCRHPSMKCPGENIDTYQPKPVRFLWFRAKTMPKIMGEQLGIIKKHIWPHVYILLVLTRTRVLFCWDEILAKITECQVIFHPRKCKIFRFSVRLAFHNEGFKFFFENNLTVGRINNINLENENVFFNENMSSACY